MTEKNLEKAMMNIREMELECIEISMKKEPDIVPSQQFEEQMSQLIRDTYGTYPEKAWEEEEVWLPKTHRRLRFRYLLVAILLLVFMTSTVIAGDSFKETLKSIVYTVFPDHVSMDGTEAEQKAENRTAEMPKKEPQYMPEGYEVYEVDSEEGYFLKVWINEKGNTIDYMEVDPDQTSVSITANGEKPENIKVGTHKAKIFSDEHDIKSIFYEEQGINYIVSGELPGDELVKIAESIR